MSLSTPSSGTTRAAVGRSGIGRNWTDTVRCIIHRSRLNATKNLRLVDGPRWSTVAGEWTCDLFVASDKRLGKAGDPLGNGVD